MNLLLIYIVVIGGIFVFMTSRGNRKRRDQASQLQNALAEGAQVRTIGGLLGEVVEITDEHVVVETTPGVKLKFVKSAIAGVIAPEEPEAETAEDEDDGEALSEDGAEQEHAAEADGGQDTEAGPSDAVPAKAEADEAALHAAAKS